MESTLKVTAEEGEHALWNLIGRMHVCVVLITNLPMWLTFLDVLSGTELPDIGFPTMLE